MNPLLCSGCGRRVGLTPTKMRGYVYCSTLCSRDFPVSVHEERDALATELARRSPLAHVARALGISRQRVQQIIAARTG